MPERKFKVGKAFLSLCLLILLSVLAYELIELPFKRLVVDLAARAYELDHGQYPTSLNQLVPDYLNAVPVDPVTGVKLTN